MKKIFKFLIIAGIICSQMVIFGQEDNKKIKPEFRLIVDFFLFPYYYEFQNKMYGTSINGSIICGVRFNQFTLGAEINEHYVTLTEYSLDHEYKGAWNILRGTIDGYYEPVNWFELKFALGGAWYKSAFESDEVTDTDIFGMNTGGISFVLDGIFRPWKYIQLRLMNRLDLFFYQGSVSPYYTGMIRCDFHPYVQWLNLSTGIGVMTWITNNLPVNENTAILVWELGISIDITPVRLAKKKETKVEEKKIEKNEEKTDEKIKEFEKAKEGDVITFDNIIFYADSEKIKEESHPVLDKIAKVLKERPEICIEIRGYTNNVNKPKEELELSKKRAEVVMKYLIDNGIDSKRMKAFGYGALYSTTIIDEANRKVEIKIVECK